MSDSFLSSHPVPPRSKFSSSFRKTWLLHLGVVLALPGVLPLSFLTLCLTPRPLSAQSKARSQAHSQKESYYTFTIHNREVISWQQMQLRALRQMFGVDDQTARLLNQSIIWRSDSAVAGIGKINMHLEIGLYQRILQKLGQGAELEAADFSPPPTAKPPVGKANQGASSPTPGTKDKSQGGKPTTRVSQGHSQKTTPDITLSSGSHSQVVGEQEQATDSSFLPSTPPSSSSSHSLFSHSLSSSSDLSDLSGSSGSSGSVSFPPKEGEKGQAEIRDEQILEGAKQLFTQRTGALAQSAEKTHPGLLNALAQHLQQAKTQLDALPLEIQNELLLAEMTKGTALSTAYSAKDWPILIRLSRKLAMLSEPERLLYHQLALTSTRLEAVEKSLDLFLSVHHELQTAPKPVSSPKLQEQNQKSEEDLMGKEVAEAMWKDFDVRQLKTLSVDQKRALARKLMATGSHAQLSHMVKHPLNTVGNMIKSLVDVKGLQKNVSSSLDALKRKDLSSYERYAEQLGLGGHISGFAAGWLGVLALVCAPEMAAVIATTALILAVESVICSTVEAELRIEAAAQAQDETGFITHTTKAAQAHANAVAGAVMLAVFEGTRALGKTPPVQKYLASVKQTLGKGLRHVDFVLWKKGAFPQAMAAYQQEVLRFFQGLEQEQQALTQTLASLRSGEELLQKIIVGDESLQKIAGLSQEGAAQLQEQLQGSFGKEALNTLLRRLQQGQAHKPKMLRLFQESILQKLENYRNALQNAKTPSEAIKLLESLEEEFSEAGLGKQMKPFWEKWAKEQMEVLSQTEQTGVGSQGEGQPSLIEGQKELIPPQDSTISSETPQDPMLSAQAPKDPEVTHVPGIPLDFLPDTLQKMKVTLQRLQEQSFAYKGLTFEKFWELIKEDWKQQRYQGAKTRTLAEQVEAMRLGLEEILRLRAVAEALWKAEQALPKDKRPNPTQKISKMSPVENVAYATIQVEGLVKKVLAVSRDKVNLPKEVGGYEVVDPKNFKGQQVFEPQPLEGQDNLRGTDSEYRILEYVARELKHQLGENATLVKGHIDLFSERYFCKSCEDIIHRFQSEFPEIKIQYNSGPFRPKDIK